MRKTLKLGVFLCAAALVATAAEPVGSWPQWRGPHHNGASTDAADLPVTWSETENVKWKIDLPSWSAGTPVIWGDTVFVTSAQQGFSELQQYQEGGGPGNKGGKKGGPRPASPPDTGAKHDKIFLLNIDRSTGAIRWTKEIGAGNRVYRKQNLSSPSPITNGRHVWTMTGAGSLRCFDMTGKQIWARDIQADYGELGLNHGYASTPLLHKGKLYVQVLHGMKTDEPSYVFAVDPKTGKTLWKVDRPTDATHESPDDYSTPVIVNADGGEQLVISGGDYVTGHELATGKEIWRMGGFNPNAERFYRTIASSIVIGDVVYTTSTRGKPFIAFKAGGHGDISDKATVWSNDDGSDVPTPTTDGKLIYVVNDRGIASALDAKTGKAVWGPERTEPGTYSSSPLLADGKLYATSEDGVTVVMKAGPTFEMLSVNRLDSHTLASPVAVGRQIFLRTADRLYCFEKR